MLIAFCAGCPQYADPTVPNEIRRIEEPVTKRDYFVYVPSRYTAAKPIPLVVLCHGTQPWDNPLREIRDWVKLAEEENFIVAAPYLEGTKGAFTPPAKTQIALQREDERTILAVVRHISGANHVDRTRTFLAGWSAGGYAVLYTGLKHPETFRALAVLQGNFDSAYLSEVADGIDPYQPVNVLYSAGDVLVGGQAKECVQWLYDQDAYVMEDLVAGGHRSHPRAAYAFFERVVREAPWLHLQAYGVSADEPLTVQFRRLSSFEPRTYDWSFGDGETSPIAEPAHTYAEPGEYEVTLVATTMAGDRLKRKLIVVVPYMHFEHGLDE